MPIRPHFRPLVKPPLTVEKIVSWAYAFKEQHGRFPINDDGIVPGELTQTWCGVDNALRAGTRGVTHSASCWPGSVGTATAGIALA